MIEEGLFAYLSGLANLADNRVYPHLLPQNPTYPCIVYRREGSGFNSVFNKQTELVAADFDVDCFSDTYFEALTIAVTARKALQNFQGLMGTTTVKQTFVVNEIDLFEINPGVYRRSFNLTIWHYEE